ncbi:DNA mismatch repair enzyme (predicted ATPase) [Halanaeroarchaeum sp. HSR-CO]|uniref:DNA mismatch repair endonuclease MutL n=1 Tax=Halanaeroarchaeum sp. HSR-CO TaxID=2866382 RepID=UPI00217DCE8D|nr:DNA mismatch repair endonuclease MutL [Halanaeroarchaeum sp. HSR-CO]UWG46998.1 DNA mismatch repair enzyme (predicted ATPase) [Halanaeroarchaeum sp. HSR-CO]
MSEYITRLDDRTIERIAAGEVVERPASVVKELVENSLDAGADRIDVSVTGNGTDRIEVADDGRGMSEADVRAAVEQHTTSKIRDIDDLAAGVGTLGFRGEALHTIGAVSRMTVTTRPQDGADIGTELRMVGGEVESVSPAGRPPGTTVTVEDLFFNTPAREKYLKTDATEFAHVNRVVTRYALANPSVAVSLSHDGNRVFATTGQGDVREAMLAVYGREVAESMIPVDHETTVATVEGYVSDPETTRSAREYVSTYVNGRYVRDGDLRGAVVSAYGKQLAADRYPFATLFVDVPPETVDVNVHPRKMEVRFDDETAVYGTIEDAVEDALLDHGLVRSSAPRGRSAPDETPVGPEGHHDGDLADEATAGATDPENVVREGDSPNGITGSESDTASGGPTRSSSDAGAGQPTAAADSTGEPVGDATDRSPDGPTTDTDTAPAPPSSDADADRKFAGPLEHPGLTDVESTTDFETLPPLRVLGQVHDTYVVAESPDGLVLVDQHAADERINYERLAKRLATRRDSQTLVSPVEVALTAHEASVFDEALVDLRAVGFEAHRDDRTAVVEAVPAVLSDALDPSLLRDVLASFLEADERDLVDSAADALISDLACYPSITGNTSLSDGDVVALLSRLDDCENPFSCPHGRPVIIEFSEQELKDRFERDYPGHQVRRRE